MIPVDQQNSRGGSTVIFRHSILFLRIRKIAQVIQRHLMTNRRGYWRWWRMKGKMSSSPELRVCGSFALTVPLFPSCSFSHTQHFFCWPGTGKSLLLRAIIATLKKKHAKKPDVVSVTASTGMAASNIGGAFFLLQPTGTLRSRHFLQFMTSWADPNFVALCLQV